MGQKLVFSEKMAAKTRVSVEQIKEFILNAVTEKSSGIIAATAKEFGISRQTASRHIRALVREGLLETSGTTKGQTYELATLAQFVDVFPVTPDLEEDEVWREAIVPHLDDIKQNVLDICQYGFTEMVNNVVSHSGAMELKVGLELTPLSIKLFVLDDGVGIFNKLQQDLGFKDPRHALLELSKGKVTSDPAQHTGEGIFFTSRMFDSFLMLSGTLGFAALREADDWLIEVGDREPFDGTCIELEINIATDLTTKEVFDRFAGEDAWDFSKTHVPIQLARYGREQLLSRSQARRVLARFDNFSEVLLDFRGVEMIGQGFADEIFRVFRNAHPEITIMTINTSPEIETMIRRVGS